MSQVFFIRMMTAGLPEKVGRLHLERKHLIYIKFVIVIQLGIFCGLSQRFQSQRELEDECDDYKAQTYREGGE